MLWHVFGEYVAEAKEMHEKRIGPFWRSEIAH